MVGDKAVAAKDMRLIIGASTAGTIFEWYDFFIYATLATIIGKTFFPSGSETLQMLLVWAGFAVGFGFRPLGAILFGYLGDKLGRKYTFLATVMLMGIATAGVGLVPSAASIGFVAPVLILLLRVSQGLALGGEYGGAAIYVCEHAADSKRGFFTSFIQAGVVGGFVLSLAVVLACKWIIPVDIWEDWGWRVPFLLSLLLLAFSLWMRLKLSESPVFQEMKEQGELAGNPFVESFTYPGNKKRIFVALFGVAAGLTVVWYTATFSALNFLVGPMRMDETLAQVIVGLSCLVGMGFYILFGYLSDRIGRRKPIVIGYVLVLLVLFPSFWIMGHYANPGLAQAAERAPVVVFGPNCAINPLATVQESACGKLLAKMTANGAPYTVEPGPVVQVSVGGQVLADVSPETIIPALESRGYDFARVKPSVGGIAMVVIILLVLLALSGATYGPVAVLLTELFPARIRYSSMSIPYHIGTGYFGGVLPLVSQYIIARTGDAYSGLWYTMAVVAMSLLVCLWGLPETRGDHPLNKE
ncbi:MFS transporter [Sphingobium subterraneum]|uniref:MFS family permease n=1 Tax=Sphingobium subterraneum TaxID=627688 RepID=A0A841IYQ1_9SPHN|nr:MFS transporter [Sphingobium subterraneum]MBB6123262.1 MFS family permease [Sphingobium subterraneum]